MKRSKSLSLIASAIVVASLAMVPDVNALLITPGDAELNGAGTGKVNPLNASQVEDILQAAGISIEDGTLTEAYKSDEATTKDGPPVALGSDSGPFAGSYQTTYSNPVGDPSNATIEYLGGAFISGSPIWLGVKDGNNSPFYYLFDISGWNGTDTIYLEGFWPDRGAISHVAIFTNVPDAGTTVMLLGAGMIAVGTLRRRLRK